jgi:O-antigen/teichoic acid export membrane protein
MASDATSPAVERVEISPQPAVLFRQSLHYVTGTGLYVLASVISYPVFTRVFSRTEYGLMALVSTALYILVSLSKMGLQQSAIRFYPEFSGGDKQRLLRSSLTFAVFASGCAGALVMCLAAIVLPSSWSGGGVRQLLILASPIIVLEALKALFLNFMRAAQQSARYSTLLTIDRYGLFGFSLAFVLFVRHDLVGFYEGWLLWSFLVVAVLVVDAIRTNAIGIRSFSADILREAVRFGFPLVSYELCNMVLTYADRYMVAHYLGPEATGLYAAAYNFTLCIQALLVIPLASLIFPWASEIWVRSGKEKTSRFASEILKYYLLIGVPLLLGVVVLREPAMVVMASRKYADAANLLPWLAAAQVLFGVYQIMSLGLFVEKRSATLAKQMAAATILNILVNFWLIPHKGLMGAAWATFFAFVFLVVLAARTSLPLLPIGLDTRSLGKAVLSGVVMGLCVHLLSFGSSLSRLLVGVLGGAVIYLGLILLTDRSLRDLARQSISHLGKVSEEPNKHAVGVWPDRQP